MAEKKKFLLRIEPGLYASLERWAADDLRSVNTQIEFLLSEAVRKAGRGRGEPPPRSGPGGSSATPPPGGPDEDPEA